MRAGLGRRPRETVEDDIEAVLELVPIVVTGFHRDFGDEVGQVGVLPRGNGSSMVSAISAIFDVVSNGRFIFVRAKP
jgi:hypothetical protein